MFHKKSNPTLAANNKAGLVVYRELHLPSQAEDMNRTMRMAHNEGSGRAQEKFFHPWLMRGKHDAVDIMCVGVFRDRAAS